MGGGIHFNPTILVAYSCIKTGCLFFGLRVRQNFKEEKVIIIYPQIW